MALKSYMDKVLISHGSLEMVPMQKRHIIPLYGTLSNENLFEVRNIYKLDLMETLMSCLDMEDTFVIEKKSYPLAILGVNKITHEKGIMWTMFSNKMKDNWFSFVKASPKLIRYLHTMYDEITVETWEGNNKMVEWLGWLGFDVIDVTSNEHGFNLIHFVRCNQDKKNVYAFPSRPVIH